MAYFDTVFAALKDGASVRRDAWEPETKMHASDDDLLCQRAGGQPYPYSLAWYEINATDWQVVAPTSSRQQMQL